MSYPLLSAQLAGDDIVVAPGVYDAFSAASAERAGFSVAYLSGASIAYSRFGRPDIGLVSMDEVAQTVLTIRERLDLPLIVDADTGFGNALNVQRTVRLFERCGASALQIEDQAMPKRCGHLKGKTLVPAAEVVGKIKAATDARASDETLIIARTDAIAVEGFSAAMDRAELFVEAGADVLFIEAPQDDDQMKVLTKHFHGRIPLLANMVEGGATPMHDAASLQAMGYKLVIFPGGLVRARAHMEQNYFASLKEAGWNQPFRDRMLDVVQLNDLLGTEQILQDGQKYDAANFESKK
jgi:2-methylisocitrate lyase-like PEP mutase family enzyme